MTWLVNCFFFYIYYCKNFLKSRNKTLMISKFLKTDLSNEEFWNDSKSIHALSRLCIDSLIHPWLLIFSKWSPCTLVEPGILSTVYEFFFFNFSVWVACLTQKFVDIFHFSQVQTWIFLCNPDLFVNFGHWSQIWNLFDCFLQARFRFN